MRPLERNHDSLKPSHAFLVAICRRNAPDELDAAAVEPLFDDSFRQELLNVAAGHRLLGLTLSFIVRARALSGRTESGDREFQDLVRSVRRRAVLFEMKRDQVVTALQKAGTRPVVLKGAAIASTLYREPFERDVEDLDLLVGQEGLERAVRALEAEGYVSPPPEESRAYRRHHFHIPLDHPDSHAVEIHWALSRATAPFQLDSKEVLAQSIRLEKVGQPDLLLPRPEHMLLHLVLQNLQEGFSRLARLVDIDRLVATTPDMDWEVLVVAAKKGSLTSATALSLQLASRLLGSCIPAPVIEELRPGPVSRFNLTMMRPVSSLLNQRLLHADAAIRLHEFWLLRGASKRISLLRKMLMPHAGVGDSAKERLGTFRRWLRLGKLAGLQVFLCASAVAFPTTASGRAQMRFWSSQARSSDRL